jgi:hypothetical protein
MNKRFYLITIFLAIAKLSFAVGNHLTTDTIKAKYKEFYIIEFDDQMPVVTRNAFIDPKRIAHLGTLSDSSNSEISKLLKVDFVLVVKLKPNTKLLTFNEILDLYKIRVKDIWCPVILDDEKIDHPETILISQNQIEKVAVVKGVGGSHISITLIE